MKLGPVEFLATHDYFRPSVWIKLPRRRYLVVFFGWQWPSVMWLNR